MAAVTCEEIRQLFSARMDDALAAEERARLDAHLATCAECPREWERFAHAVGLLRAVAPARAPAGFVDRVLAARPQPWYRRLARTMFVPWPVKLPLEAAAVVLVAGLAVLIFQRSTEMQQAARFAEPLATAPAAPLPPADVPAPPADAPTPPADAPGQPWAALEPPPPATGRAPASVPVPDRRAPAEKLEGRLADETPRYTAPAREEARKEATTAARPAAPAPAGTVAETRDKGVAPPAVATPPGTDVERDASGRAGLRAAAPSRSKSGEVQRLAAVHPDALARLAVLDRATTERTVRDLVARAGGQVVARDDEPEATVLTLVVPGERWDELQRGLREIGPLRLERSRDDTVGPLRVTLRLER